MGVEGGLRVSRGERERDGRSRGWRADGRSWWREEQEEEVRRTGGVRVEEQGGSRGSRVRVRGRMIGWVRGGGDRVRLGRGEEWEKKGKAEGLGERRKKAWRSRGSVGVVRRRMK